MPPTDAAVLDALELGSLVTPMTAGKTARVAIDGVFVRDSVIASPRSNQVALARLTDADADAVIARVCAHFGARPFGWNVGPRSTPVDLERRLAAVGLEMMRESAGMVLLDPATPIDAPAIEIRRAVPADAAALAAINVAMFGQEPGEALWLQHLLLAEPSIGVWLAVEHGEILGFGQGLGGPDGILLLAGAATLPAARGKGVYRALLRHRIATAIADGVRAVIIQANDETSAPICRRVGFVEACRLRYWIRAPGQ